MAFTDEFPFLNNSTSFIVDDDVQVPAVPPNPNSIIILGTATKGPLYKAVPVNDDNISTTFGDHVDDAYGDVMLVKGYKEAKTLFPGAAIHGVRIGNATRSSLTLYENQLHASGDLSYTDITASFSVESKSDEANATEVVVRGDASGSPTSVDVTLPDGVTLNYQLDVSGAVPGAFDRVSDLVSALNNDPNFATFNVAKETLLTQDVNVTITSGLISGNIETTYDIDSGTGSYGDKLVDILAVFNNSAVTDSSSIEAGDTKSTLAAGAPKKDSDPNTETISVFSTIITSEAVLTASASDIGTTVLTLDAADDSHWDNADTTYNITNLVVTLVRGGVATTLVKDTDYTLTATTGKITLIGTYASGAQLGDKFWADYKYKTVYVEANLRSDLQTGNRYSYFVYGSDIIFGAAQRYNVQAIYNANIEYNVGVDVIVSDADNTIVKFVNPDNEPSVGDTVVFSLAYEPELPAITGTIISSTIVQESQLSGGSDGRKLIGKLLYDELEKGYMGSENMPARYLVPMGVFVDDTIQSIDFDTGLPTVINAGYIDQLSKYAKRKSRYVSECFGLITVQPMSAADINNPTLQEVNTWYNRLTVVSATDTTRPANVLKSFDDYHVVIPLGDAVFQIPGVFSGRPYVGQFAFLHASVMQNSNREEAIVNMNINPGPIVRFVYPIMNNAWINKLNQARYTLYTQSSVDGNYTIVDSPTLARATSKFDRQFVTQTVFDIIQTSRAVAKPFFGKPGFDSVRKSLETSIINRINDLYHPNRVSGFNATVFATDADKLSGKTQVLLQIVTSKEIRKIQFTTQLELT
jgi:hypothetical protein